jgi:hypothetical protein
MYELKPLIHEAIPAALEKAKRYRFLNEPDDAESICRDILAAEPNHQEALITLLLALTDRFAHSGLTPSFDQARELVPQLDGSYSKSYYIGIIFERRAKYHLKTGGPGAGSAAYECLVKAMSAYSEAMAGSDPKNQDAVLRWNSCARILNTNQEVRPEESSSREMLLDTFDTPH